MAVRKAWVTRASSMADTSLGEDGWEPYGVVPGEGGKLGQIWWKRQEDRFYCSDEDIQEDEW